MLRSIVMSVLIAAPCAVSAQSGDPQAIARAEAMNACAGRPVASARVVNGGLSVTCVDADSSPTSKAGTGGLSGGAIAIIGLLGLGLMGAGGGGGGSSGGTN